MRVRLVLIGAALAVGLLVAGCSSDNETSTGGTTTLPEPPVNSVVTTVPSGITPLVNVATNPLGQILVDQDGMTLYILTDDTPGMSTCVDTCAQAWPPLEAAIVTTGAGLVGQDFLLIARPDGTQQISANGQPLYRFAGDSQAGETMGQGVGNKWYVVGTDGLPIMGAAGGAGG
jgi:predicted lipoprotein with Yx(FWY)xxD motif